MPIGHGKIIVAQMQLIWTFGAKEVVINVVHIHQLILLTAEIKTIIVIHGTDQVSVGKM